MIIGILTDFGVKDQYVFQMKSVISRINPSALVYDITHEITKFDIWEGSFILCQAVKYAPADSILIGVVDPGVATKRKAIAIRTKTCILVGPDNGLLYEAARREGIEEIRRISSEKVIMKRGSTFDGRDVFAPTAGHLSLGMKFSDLGERLDKIARFTFPVPRYMNDRIEASILHVDHFRNAILNVPAKNFERWSEGKHNFYIRTGITEWTAKFSSSYEEMKELELGLIEGSTGFIEISSYEKGAPDELENRGQRVTILK